MDNLRDLQAQARNLERSGQHAAALELYTRILEEPTGDEDGGIWARAGNMRRALGDDSQAADSYAVAVERYAAAGYDNLALSFCQRLLRIDESRTEILLRFGQISAAQGYARDARHGYVEYADLAAAADDVSSAVGALREYLGHFPSDTAVRRRISELTGEPESEPEPKPPPRGDISELAGGALPGLIPTTHESEAPEESSADLAPPPPPRDAGPSDAGDDSGTGPGSYDLPPPLEGFEPTQAGSEEAEPLPLLGLEDEERDERDREAGGDAIDADRAADEQSDADALPLLGTDASHPSHAPTVPTAVAPLESVGSPASRRQSLAQEYLALAGRFEAELDTGKAQESLKKVLELDPANEEARAALASITAASTPPRDYVDLGELILSGAPEEMTRFQVAIGDPTGNEENDFAEILQLFRKKVSESLDPKDAASHYDLGLAFKEMGLLEDAIVHLQSALRGGANPLATLEVLGECFVLKGQLSLATRVFERATRLDRVGDSNLVGVLYGLARSQERLGQVEEAASNFERVVAVDLSFRDAAERLEALRSA